MARVPSPSLAYSAQASGAGPLILIAGRVGGPHGPVAHRDRGAQPDTAARGVAADQWAAERTGPGPLRRDGRRRCPGLVPPGRLAHHAPGRTGRELTRSRRPWPPRGRGWRRCDERGRWCVRGSARVGVRFSRPDCARDAGMRASIGALAVLMGSLCIQPLLDGAGGCMRTIVVVAIIALVGGLARSLRVPAPLQPPAAVRRPDGQPGPAVRPRRGALGVPARACGARPPAGARGPGPRLLDGDGAAGRT